MLAAAVALLLPAGSAAQAAPEPRLTLGEVVATALEKSRSIAVGRRQVDVARAELVGARGVFDTRWYSTAGGVQHEQQVFDTAGGVATAPVSSRSSSYALGGSRELRSGVVLEPGLSLTRTDDPLSGPVPFGQAGAGLGITVPLGYNRWGRISRSAEQVASIGADASEHRFRQTVADHVHEVIGAYWSYRAAHERLAVYRTSEARAERLLQETRTLVDAQERPAADLNQVRANVASKRMNGLAAEQGVRVARQRLGLAMGLGAAESARLPLPGDTFAVVRRFAADAMETGRLLSLAAAQRPELAASGLRLRSAELLRRTARDATKPRLDLVLNLGYTGLTTSSDLAGAFSPFYHDIPGLNARVELSYQGSFANRQARGNESRRAAILDQERLSLTELTERVASGVILAIAALEQSQLIVAESETAVQLYRSAVDNEKKKHELGVATLFDVIAAEDNLTNAQLASVEGRLDHSLSLSGLRYQTGVLVRGGSADVPFTVDAPGTPP